MLVASLIAENLNDTQQTLRYVIYGIVGIIVTFWVAFFLIKKIGKDPRNILPVNFAKNIQIPLLLFLVAIVLWIGKASNYFPDKDFEYVAKHLIVAKLLTVLSLFLLALVGCMFCVITYF